MRVDARQHSVSRLLHVSTTKILSVKDVGSLTWKISTFNCIFEYIVHAFPVTRRWRPTGRSNVEAEQDRCDYLRCLHDPRKWVELVFINLYYGYLGTPTRQRLLWSVNVCVHASFVGYFSCVLQRIETREAIRTALTRREHLLVRKKLR